ncbi:hypothetical protein JCM10207_008839 [Rhodosporidiobolus poonsookiae]
MASSPTTVSILPTQLRLVHIPLSLKHALMAKILDVWWFRRDDDPFFALCNNGVELSLFADASSVRRCFSTYMDPPALSRSASLGSAGVRESRPGSKGRVYEVGAGLDRKGKGRQVEMEERVQVGEELWVALEIAFGGNGWEEAGPRVHSLSAPLAARGISILFLSTFASDYILVPASSLQLVTSILEEEGFGFSEPEERDVLDALVSAADEEDDELSDRGGSVPGSGWTTRRGSRDDGGLALASMTGSLVLSDEGGRSSPSNSRSRSRTRTRSRTNSPALSRANSLGVSFDTRRGDSPSSSLSTSTATLPAPTTFASPTSSSPTSRSSPSHSLSPPTPAVPPPLPPGPGRSLTLLPDELVCVGLSTSPGHETLWRQKIVEVLFFPERVLPPSSASSASAAAPTPFLALTQTPDSASLTADVRLLRAGFLGGGAGGVSADEVLFTVGPGGLGGSWAGEERDVGEVEAEGGAAEGGDGKGWWEALAEDDEAHGSASETEGETTEDEEDELRHSAGDDEGVEGGRTLLKCLQLDLIRFGLDKPGLVEHYASLLISSGITSLLYQSTYGSANILVAKRDVHKARRVLARG